MYNRGGYLSAGDVAKGIITGLSTFGPLGWAYAGLDIGTAVFTGRSITDRIGDAVDDALPTAKMKVY